MSRCLRLAAMFTEQGRDFCALKKLSRETRSSALVRPLHVLAPTCSVGVFPCKPSALTPGLGSQVAVQLRAWSWPVWVAHCLSRLLMLAQWLAGSSSCWRIFEWCGYPLWHRLPVLGLFALWYRCRVLPLCNLFELCFCSHYISH